MIILSRFSIFLNNKYKNNTLLNEFNMCGALLTWKEIRICRLISDIQSWNSGRKD